MRFTSNRSDRKQNRRQGRREEKKRYLRHVTVDEEPSLRRLWRLKLKMDGWLRPKKTNKQSERKVDTIFLFAEKKYKIKIFWQKQKKKYYWHVLIIKINLPDVDEKQLIIYTN